MSRIVGMLVSALLLVAQVVVAQGDSSALRLETLTTDDLLQSLDDANAVTGTDRSAQKLEESSYTIHVVSREQILDNGYNTLVDVLKDVPAFKVSQPGSALDGETFVLRGLYGNYYTKILINSIPIMPSVVGGMPIGAQLPIKQAERIEITYGPAAAVYGSDAMGGVINIITRDPDLPVYAQADLGVGSLAYTNLNIMLGGKSGQGNNILSYNLWGGFSSIDDHNIKYDLDSNYNPAVYDPSLSFLGVDTYTGSEDSVGLLELPSQSQHFGADFAFGDFKFSGQYMYRYSHAAIGSSPLYVSYDDPASYYGESIYRVTGTYQKTFSRLSLTSNLSYLHYRVDDRSSYVTTQSLNGTGLRYMYGASDDLFAEQIASWRFNEKWNLTLGGAYQVSGNLPLSTALLEPFDTELYRPFSRDSIARNIVYDQSTGVFTDRGLVVADPIVFTQTSGFGELNYTGERLHMQAGARYDLNGIFGSSLSPRVGMTYRLNDNHIVRASGSMANRMPSSYYRYNSFQSVPFPQVDTAIFVPVPNPNLKNEQLLVVEAGMRHTLSEKLSVDWNVYWNRLQNHLSFGVASDNVGPVGSLDYVGFATDDDGSTDNLYGLEARLRWTDIVESIHLRTELYAGYNTGNYEFPLEGGSVDSWLMQPTSWGQMRVTAEPWEKLLISLRATFSGSWISRGAFDQMLVDNQPDNFERDGFLTLDVNARYKVHRMFQIYGKVKNITNQEYAGIDATGTFYDLRYNPQMGIFGEFGLSFRFN